VERTGEKQQVTTTQTARQPRREVALAGVLVVLAVAVGMLRPDYLRPENLRDILVNASIPALVAAGMTALIITGQIDISVGAILAVSATTVVWLARAGWPAAVLPVAGIGVGALLGAVNGALTAGLRVPAIVATLATVGALRGLLILVTRGSSSPSPPELTALGASGWLGLPVPTWVAAAVCIGMSLYLACTHSGRRHYAVGSQARSAELSGIPVPRVVFGSFLLVGALTGLAGFLYVCRFTPVYPTPPRGFELEVITAVVVGGAEIAGGRGTVPATVLAAVLLSAIGVSLTFIGSSFTALRSEIQPAVQGLLVLAAVLYTGRERRGA